MKAKQWLLDNGHIEAISRGRISLVNHERLKTAAEGGMQFSDWPKGTIATETRTDAKGETKTVTTVKRDPKSYGAQEIQEIAPYRYNHHTHAAFELELIKNKRVERSLREVCYNCQVSLVQCGCGQPTIVNTRMGEPVRVVIESKF